MSGIYKYRTKAGEPRWRIVFDGPPDPDTGHRRQTSRRGFTRERDAKKALREALGRVDDGSHVDRSTQTLAEYLRAWLDGLRVKPTTLEGYRVSVGKIVPRIGGVKLQALTAEHVDKLYRDLERRGKRAGECPTAGVTCRDHGCAPERHGGLGPKSVRHVHTMLRKALADAVRRGHVSRNVADLANPPTQRQARSRATRDNVWSGEQLRAFLEHVADDRLYAAWRLLATTGMRRAELLGLRWSDLDLEAATARVGEQTLTTVGGEPVWVDGAEGGKTESASRTLALDDATAAALRAWRKRQLEERMLCGDGWHDDAHGPLVFTREDGQPVHPERFLGWLGQHAKRAGLPPVDVHGVRHSYATAALRAGMRVDVLSKRLGHSDPSITLSVYAHVLDGDDAEAATTAATAIFGG